MCQGSNNFRNGDYATANFFFLRKKMPILDKFVCASAKSKLFAFGLLKFLDNSRPPTSVTRGNTHCCGSHWWAAKINIFPLFVLVLGNLLLAPTCASIASDITVS